MKTRIMKMFVLAPNNFILLFLFIGLGLAHAAPVPVPNFSFEFPAKGDGGDQSLPVFGWKLSVTDPLFPGAAVFNPRESEFTGASASPGTLPTPADGLQVLTFEDTVFTSVTNDVSLGKLTNGAAVMIYTLIVAVGTDKGTNQGDHPNSLPCCGPGSYQIELLAGETPLSPSSSFHPVPLADSFADATNTYVISAGHPLIGSNLSVRLSSSSGATDTVPVRTYFDNVRLDATPANVAPPPPPTGGQAWNGGGDNDNWSTAANWGGVSGTGGTTPVNDGSANLVFSGTTRLTPNTDVPWNVRSIAYASSDGAFAPGAFTNVGMKITIQDGGVVNQSTNTQTINNDVLLGVAQSWGATAPGPGTLDFGGAVDNNGFLLTVSGNPGTSIAINGPISGTGGLTKTGAGTLTLGGVNLYTGSTTINAGTLRISTGSNRLPTSTSITLANVPAATLNLNNFDQTIGSLAGGGDTGGNVTLGTATLGVGGNDASASYAGVISGTGGLTKTGSGLLEFSNTNTFSGPTTISGGTLYVVVANALSNTTAVILNTTGSLFLGANATVNDTAAIILNGGTLQANNATETFGVLSLTNNSTINLAAGGAAGVLTFSGASLATPGSILTISGWSGSAGQSGTDDKFIISADPGMSFLQAIQFTGYSPGATRLLSGEIVPPAATLLPASLSLPTRLSDNQFKFHINGVAAQSYTIQYSTTLTNWVSLLTTNAPSAMFDFVDLSATNPVGFYRVVSP